MWNGGGGGTANSVYVEKKEIHNICVGLKTKINKFCKLKNKERERERKLIRDLQ